MSALVTIGSKSGENDIIASIEEFRAWKEHVGESVGFVVTTATNQRLVETLSEYNDLPSGAHVAEKVVRAKLPGSQILNARCDVWRAA